MVLGVSFDNHLAYWNADPFDADQYSEIVLGANPSEVGVAVRVSGSSMSNVTGYWLEYHNSAEVGLHKYMNGTPITNLTLRTGLSLVEGDTLRLEVEGTTLRIRVNGVQLGAGRVDADIATGAAGFLMGNISASQADDWEGGNVSGGPLGGGPLVVYEPFTGNGELSSGWSTIHAAANRNEDMLQGGSHDNHLAYWSADVFNANQYSQIVLGANPSEVGVAVRISGTTISNVYAYWLEYNNSSEIGLHKYVGGESTYQQVAERTGLSLSEGDTMRLEVEGTTLRIKVNGVQLGAAVTDNSIAVGAAGFLTGNPNLHQADNWEGGDLSSQGSQWPPLTEYATFDTLKTVALPNDTFLVYRTEIALRFKSNVSDPAKVAFFAAHAMTVIGVTSVGTFFVRIPDPGASWPAFQSALELVGTYPEVSTATLIPHTQVQESASGRYPNDGPDHQRVDWFGNATSTWAMRTVRAPLAWSCENGEYNGPLVPIGILEFKHQPGHPEFNHPEGPAPQLREPSDASLGALPPRPPFSVAEREAHGAHVTGVLGARGNNGSGVAGMLWRSRLFLYAAYSSGNRSLPLFQQFSVLGDRMVADGIRVLSISVDQYEDNPNVPQAQRREVIRRLAEEFRVYLRDRLPQLIVVLAAGNERWRGTLADYLALPSVRFIRAALLTLKEEPEFRDRIIVVAGTQAPNNFWEQSPGGVNGSNFFTGLTDIAAPARDVGVLDRWAGGEAVPFTLGTGTSLSAPMVAGTAGLLLTMDPTLTPAKVKEFILLGAREPRVVPRIPMDEDAVPVAGAPQTVYQLDAYGALNLLSLERQGSPVCGIQVRPGGEAVPGTVTLERFPLNLWEPLVVGTGDELALQVSVANGGRVLASRLQSSTTIDHRAVQFTHKGVVSGTLSGILERRFLERDTADIFEPPQGSTLANNRIRITGPTVQTGIVDLAGGIEPNSESHDVNYIEPAPDASRAILESFFYTFVGNNEVWVRVDIVPVSGSGALPVFEQDFPSVTVPDCFNDCYAGSVAAWSRDSRFAFAYIKLTDRDVNNVSNATAWRTRIRRVNIATSNIQTSVIQDWHVVRQLATSPEDSVFVTAEQNMAGECRVAARNAANPGQLLGTFPFTTAAYCDLAVPAGVLPNVRIADNRSVSSPDRRLGVQAPKRSGTLYAPARVPQGDAARSQRRP